MTKTPFKCSVTLAELLAAAGLDHPAELTPGHILKRTAPGQLETFEQAYDFLEPGELLSGVRDPLLRDAWSKARSDAFSLA